jgi:hypothetical protein
MVARLMHTGTHFAAKTVILDSRKVDTLLAMPL